VARNNGESGEVPDSLISEFRTRGGRKVYDGGGIVPDVKIEPKYWSRFAVAVYAEGHIKDWVDKYVLKHRDLKVDVRSFELTDEDYATFAKLVQSRDVPYKSESRRAVEKLRKSLESERYDAQQLTDAMAVIEKGLKDDKMSNLQTYKQEIVQTINADIVLRYCYAAGRIANGLNYDKGVKAAVQMLSTPAEMERILREQDTDRK
jgi:carboxyl-terminal processing protease